MTNEQKLLTLLRIAVENGYVIEGLKYPKPITDRFWQTATVFMGVNGISIEGNLTEVSYNKKHFTVCHSLNDLVSNWEEGEVSFIDTLCIALQKTAFFTNINVLAILETFDIELAAGRMRSKWVYQPTSQRLDWLFETFNHLLQ